MLQYHCKLWHVCLSMLFSTNMRSIEILNRATCFNWLWQLRFPWNVLILTYFRIWSFRRVNQVKFWKVAISISWFVDPYEFIVFNQYKSSESHLWFKTTARMILFWLMYLLPLGLSLIVCNLSLCCVFPTRKFLLEKRTFLHEYEVS